MKWRNLRKVKRRIRKNRKRKKKMSNHIDKNDPDRFFLIQSNTAGEEGIICFGYVGEQGTNQLETGQPNLATYLTEQELETQVNIVAAIPNYYQDAVEDGSPKFIGESGIYEALWLKD